LGATRPTFWKELTIYFDKICQLSIVGTIYFYNSIVIKSMVTRPMDEFVEDELTLKE
jgi:hypothetical protein